MIKPKLKECSECKSLVVLWRSNPPLCKVCAFKTSGTSKKTKSPAKRIKSVSTKKLSELAEYRKVRDAYLKANKICEHPDCKSPSEDLHHAKGRVGALLTDVRYFKALCRKCHRWAEENPDQAKALGISLSRLGNDDGCN